MTTCRVGGLYSLVLVLAPTVEATLGATMGHQAHAAFLDAIRVADPALSATLHASGVPVRPFTMSPLLGTGRPRGDEVTLSPERTYALRCTVLDAAVYERFMARFLQSDGRPLLRLGRASLLIREIRTTPGSHPWAGYTTWQELADGAQPRPELTLEFASPTAFSFGQKAWGKKIVLLPQPELVFDSLARAWNLLAPASLQVDRQALAEYLKEHAVIKQLRISTRMLRFARSPQVGFTGQATYGLMQADGAARRQLAMLAEFAFYAGVGYKTTMGMGQCRRIEDGPSHAF